MRHVRLAKYFLTAVCFIAFLSFCMGCGRIGEAAGRTKAGTERVFENTKSGTEKVFENTKSGTEKVFERTKEGTENTFGGAKEGFDKGYEEGQKK